MSKKSSFIPLSEPCLSGNEWKYVKECLDTGWVSSVGSYVVRFEEKIATYVGSRHAVSCINGTSALHTALMSVGLKANEEVVVPAMSFVAPANAVHYCGAHPVFMDVDSTYWQLDVEKLKEFFQKECSYKDRKLINKRTRRVIRGIIPVHILGHPVDMDVVMRLAKQFDLWVIEDVAESIGALYKGHKVGSKGDIACFSFNGNKTITCGGGGMLVTNSTSLASRARYLTTQAKDDPLEYIHHEIGYNYRLTNIQAAVGLAQMECLEKYLKIKAQIANRYSQKLNNLPGLTLPSQAPWAKSIWWLYTILVNPKEYGMDSRKLLVKLAQEGIQARPLWHPLHSLKPFQSSYAYQVEVANRLYQQALSLPSSVQLKVLDQNKVIRLISQGQSI